MLHRRGAFQFLFNMALMWYARAAQLFRGRNNLCSAQFFNLKSNKRNRAVDMALGCSPPPPSAPPPLQRCNYSKMREDARCEASMRPGHCQCVKKITGSTTRVHYSLTRFPLWSDPVLKGRNPDGISIHQVDNRSPGMPPSSVIAFLPGGTKNAAGLCLRGLDLDSGVAAEMLLHCCLSDCRGSFTCTRGGMKLGYSQSDRLPSLHSVIVLQ